MLRHIHRATTASARPPRQTRTHILEGRLPGRCHVAQLHPVHERTHAISSVPLRSLAMSGPVSLCDLTISLSSSVTHMLSAVRLSSLPGNPHKTRSVLVLTHICACSAFFEP